MRPDVTTEAQVAEHNRRLLAALHGAAYGSDEEVEAVRAAKRATLPSPPKYGRQRAPVNRDTFVAKRDAKRRMRKASRRARR